jgi:hypothetical protein
LPSPPAPGWERWYDGTAAGETIKRADAMSGLGAEAGTTSAHRRWLLPALSLASSALSFLAFGAYQGLHVKLIRPLQPNEMAWLVSMAHAASELLAIAALVLAAVAIVRGRRWQRVAGLVALLPALAVCTLGWMITF